MLSNRSLTEEALKNVFCASKRELKRISSAAKLRQTDHMFITMLGQDTNAR